jgi:hypothetical protein
MLLGNKLKKIRRKMENHKCIYHRQKIMWMLIHSAPQKQRNEKQMLL